MKKIILVDASGLLFRAYFAMMRNPLRTTNGQSVSAVFGFLRMIFSLLRKNPASVLVAAFDVPRATLERSKEYSEYKSTRKETPADLIEQIPLAKECLQLAGIQTLTVDGHEADDIVATLAKKYGEDNQVVILSGDKDLMQLVGGNITMAIPDKMQEGGLRILDREGVKEQKGIYPEEILSFLSLTGDSSDNIPGVAGIGEKGALELINTYHSLDAIYENIDSIKPALAKKLIAGEESARLSFRLVTLKDDLPLSLNLSDAPITLTSLASTEFIQRLRELELFSLIKELNPAQSDSQQQELFSKKKELSLITAEDWPLLEKSSYIGLQIHESDLEIGFSGGNWRVPCDDPHLKSLLSSEKTIIAFDLKKIIHMLAPYGVQLSEADDLKIMAYLLNPIRASYSVADLMFTYLGENDTTTCRFEALKNAMGKELIGQGLWKTVYTEIEKPLRPLLAQLELAGVMIDQPKLMTMSASFEKSLAEISAKIFLLAGKEFNILSPKQVGQILFEDLGLDPVKKTKTKAYSTDEETLEILAMIHPLPREILSYRNLSKLKNTYTDALPKLTDNNSRVHTTLHQTVTATGRLSSGEPNLQNIPIRTDLGKEIRSAFIAQPPKVLVSADYSQIELRLFAALSGDENMQQYFIQGGDIHRGTAAKMFNIDESVVDDTMRRAAKTINYGISYGMSAFRLGNELNISTGEAKSFIQTYFDTFSGIRSFMEETLNFASKNGYVKTIYGRRRPCPELLGKTPDKITNLSHPSRFAINAVIQGTAADIIKIAMLKMDQLIREEFFNEVEMILQIHDELLFEANPQIIEEFIPRLKHTMKTVADISVPLEVEAGFGANWHVSH
ncbi:MAG: DNA polymerase I [Brevinema sp.]